MPPNPLMHAADAMTTCPAPEALELLAAGAPSEPALRRHVETCPSCQAIVAAIAADDALVAEVVAAERERSLLDGAIDSGAGVGTQPAARPGFGRPSACPTVPGYELLREIHRGGQGVVYEANQRSTSRRVALKLLLRGTRATPRQLRRFEREIETVAALRHPGIVTLYESGRTSTGETYFAMELVEGCTLDRAWGARRSAGGGGLAEALCLFAAICRAVTHAHQKGVIHCDLKPSNILIDADGSPRLLDFGIARMRGASEAGEEARRGFAGTFAYAAPEQLADVGDGPDDGLDVRVDIYALGVILHELLVGESPWVRCDSVQEMIRVKCGAGAAALLSRRLGLTADDERAPPPTPSDVAASRPGGNGASRGPDDVRLRRLDAEAMDIVRRAMATQSVDRYQSVAELLDDVERRLADRPISVRKDSLPYVLRKAAQRHRRLGAALVAGLAATATLSTLLLLMVVRHERERLHALDTLSAIREALAATDPLEGGGGASIEAFLARVGSHVDEHLSDHPASAAAIHGSLGQIAINAAEYELADGHLSQALLLARQAGDERTEAECLHHLGRVAFYRGDYPQAAAAYRQALARRTALLGQGHADVATTTSHLASCLRRMGELDESERLLRLALATRLGHPERPDEIAAAWNNLGSLMQERGRLDEAAAMFERALEIIRLTTPSGDWRRAHALRNRAACLIEQGRYAEAAGDLDESASIWQSVVDDDHPALASVRFQQARAALGMGRPAEAARLAQSAVDTRRARLGESHPESIEALELTGRVAIAQGRSEAAIAALSESLALRRATPTPDTRAIATTAAMLGELLARRGDHEAAGALLRESATIWKQHAERPAPPAMSPPVDERDAAPPGADAP